MRRLAFSAFLLLLSSHAFAAVRRTQWIENNGFGTVDQYRSMLAADLNHDGKADLVLMASYGVNVALGRGDGTFDPDLDLTPWDPLDGRKYRSMNVGDFTGDGFDDILVTDYGAGGLLLIVNHGDGTFAAPAAVSTRPFMPYASAAADFDGDGKLDIAASSWEGAEVVVFAGNGAGGFTEKARTTTAGDQTERIVAEDIDNDGHVDLAMTRYASSNVVLHFGRGDGSFETGPAVGAGNFPHEAVALADLNGDHRFEIVAGNFDDDTITVNVNLGGRAFSSAQAYSVVKPPRSGASPSWLAIADYNGDGLPDVAVACPNGWNIAVLTGNGDGTLNTPDFARISGGFSNSLPVDVAPADFDGDGRLDLAVYDNGGDSISVAINRTGDTTFSVTPPALMSVDKDSAVTVQVSAVVYGAPAPTGTVTLRSAGVVVGQQALNAEVAHVTFHPTSVGDQTLVAEYSGDDNYSPRSTQFVQRVTSETTTTSLSLDKTVSGYGELVVATITVTSSKGDQTSGSVTLRRGATTVTSSNVSSGRATASFGSTPVGTWMLTAEYAGDSTHPPSSSASCSMTVTKGTPRVQWTELSSIVTVGQPVTIKVNVNGSGVAPTGTVTFYDGNVSLGVATIVQSASISFTPPGGSRYLRASYSGDDRYLPADAYKVLKTVVPGAFVLDARASAGRVTLSWTPFAGTSSYRLSTKLARESEYMVARYPGAYLTSLEVDSATAPTLYRIEAVDVNLNVIAMTNAELAFGAPLADDPLIPGTVIRAVQLTDTLNAINAVRAATGAPAIVIPGIISGSVIRASDIQELRNAAIDVRARLGIPPAVFTNDPAPAGPIRAVDIQDIREAVR